MRVALVWPITARLTQISVRYERYVRGLRALGHEPVTVCLQPAAEGYAEPVIAAPDVAALRDPAFYRGLGADAAVVVTWLVLPDVVAAARAACGWVASVADSDGRVGVRTHPGATLSRMLVQQSGWGMKLRAGAYWLTLYAAGPRELEDPMLASAGQADRVAVCSTGAAGHLRRFFRSYRRPDLEAKVVAVPYPIDECYLTGPVAGARENGVVAIGRWDDPQKDPGLLCRAAHHFLAGGGRTEFHLFGPNGERWFGPLARRWPQVKYHGPQPPAVIADHLRNSRLLLLPSRWESGPIVLNEALASGCTVVGTPAVPAAVSASAEGGFGTIARSRSARGLAAALRDELAAWDRGDRDAPRIAAHWRPRFDPAAVCRAMMPPLPR
jgi:glycosyltransferase involved in cell wall biosynthesis